MVTAIKSSKMNQQIPELSSQIATRSAKCGKSVLLSIDGPAGSGKTSLAAELASNLSDVQIIHMDDLYLGWQNTLTDSLTSNLLGIAHNIQNLGIVSFVKFDWSNNSIGEVVKYQSPKFLIIEGVGSGQEALRPFISMSIWIEVPTDVGLARVIARDGEIVRDHMAAFLALQESHFKKEETKMHAEYHLSGLEIV